MIERTFILYIYRVMFESKDNLYTCAVEIDSQILYLQVHTTLQGGFCTI